MAVSTATSELYLIAKRGYGVTPITSVQGQNLTASHTRIGNAPLAFVRFKKGSDGTLLANAIRNAVKK